MEKSIYFIIKRCSNAVKNSVSSYLHNSICVIANMYINIKALTRLLYFLKSIYCKLSVNMFHKLKRSVEEGENAGNGWFWKKFFLKLLARVQRQAQEKVVKNLWVARLIGLKSCWRDMKSLRWFRTETDIHRHSSTMMMLCVLRSFNFLFLDFFFPLSWITICEFHKQWFCYLGFCSRVVFLTVPRN